MFAAIASTTPVPASPRCRRKGPASYFSTLTIAGSLLLVWARDLITRRRKGPTKAPAGIAFEIPDLVLIGYWAALHDLDALICLDHGVEDEEYEEVVEFRTEARSRCRFILWRNANGVFLQPIMGRKTEHLSVAAALGSLLPKLGRHFC